MRDDEPMVDPQAAGPTVTGVEPNIGTTLGGDSVTITGSKFTNAVSVNFGRVATTEFTVNGDGSITAITPAQAAGVVDVAVITTGGTSPPSVQFTYKAPPDITAISPDTGKGGDAVTITGSAFTEVDSVTFGDVAANYTIDSDSQITAHAPHHPNGDVVITVSTPDGNTGVDFTYAGVVSQDLTGVTIQRGEALSSALDCTQQHPLLIFMPMEGWDAAVLSFSISRSMMHHLLRPLQQRQQRSVRQCDAEHRDGAAARVVRGRLLPQISLGVRQRSGDTA